MQASLWLTGIERWRSLEDELRAALRDAGIEGGRLTVVIDPAGPPPAGTGWNWHVSFDLDHRSTEVFAAQDLCTFLFADRYGYFEISVPEADLADYILREILPTGQA
jgi:hypothetical protein